MSSRAFFSLAFYALACLLPAVAPAAPIAPANLPDLVEKVLPGVVNISSVTITNFRVYGMEDFLRFWGVPEQHKESSLGSGFLFDAERGLILTNNHVVDHAAEVVVTLMDKRQYRAKILGKDPKMDLALLEIRDQEKKVPSQLTAVQLGNSETVRIAEPVFAVGNPFGLSHTVTIGIISAKNRTIGIGPFDNFLQTDASINPGNSGGPLFNLKGEVVGINTVIYSRTGQSGGLGFAIPTNEAKAVVPDLLRYGRVPRPWLGLIGQRLTPGLARYFNIDAKEGVFVYNLVEDAPADHAGLRQGDVLLSIDEQSLADPNQLERSLYRKRPLDTVQLKVLRGQKTMTLKVKLEELPPRAEKLLQGII